MQNLTYTKVSIGTTATLVFSGTGTVILSTSSGVFFGTDNTVTTANGFSNGLFAGRSTFTAPVEIWAIGDDGADFVQVVSWY